MIDVLRRIGRKFPLGWRYMCLRGAYARATGVCVPMAVLRRDFDPWRESYQPDRSPIGDRVPWITFGARLHLERILRPGSRVFEYGAGGSTLFFLDRGCSVTTVEHDVAWLERIRACVRPGAPWTFHHVPPGPADEGDQDYLSSFPGYRGLSFRRYVHVLDGYPAGEFDIIMVNGRARGPCLAAASRLVDSKGLVILDNSERPRYAPAIAASERDGWRACHFHGPGPYVVNEFWNTTLLQRGCAYNRTPQPFV